jgi:predicted CopG family antitoxin
MTLSDMKEDSQSSHLLQRINRKKKKTKIFMTYINVF